MKKLMKIAVLGTIAGLSFGLMFGYVPVQVQFFKEALQDSTQVVNCANCDFRGVQDLAGVDAHGVHMPGVTFQPCIQTDLNKENELMICIQDQVSNLKGINLANANLFSSCFDSAILDKADLTGADLSNSSVQNATLKDAKVAGAITDNSSFCNSVMPDGAICTETWVGQGITIQCNCAEVSGSSQSKSVSNQQQTVDQKSSSQISSGSSVNEGIKK